MSQLCRIDENISILFSLEQFLRFLIISNKRLKANHMRVQRFIVNGKVQLVF
jgi:hypothetical protein